MNEKTNENYERIIVAVKDIVDWLLPIVKRALEYAADALAQYPNKRVVHLALHGKKSRTRKKNLHRIHKDLRR